MKKVLAIAPYSYLPFFSGGQKLIAQFLEYLGQATELTVISVAENDLSLAKSYRILPLLKRSFSRYYDQGLVKKITALVRKEEFDTIIWEHPYYAWLAVRIKKRTGVQTIIHTHNIEYQRFRSTHRWWWPILKVYEKWSFKKTDKIFFITPEDRDFAIQRWKIKKEKCIDLPFGIDIKNYPADRVACREAIASKYFIAPDEKILMFSGALGYKPNLDALKVILDTINPLLLSQPGFRYKLFICGQGLPDELNSLKNYIDKNIIYTGFVRDIETYCKAASILLNPVQSGGGIKTKMVEAIAYGATVIATETGASGIERSVCGEKLIIVPDNDWQGFSRSIIDHPNSDKETPEEYYHHYYWGHILQKAIARVNSVATN
jgi:polysaccharide biosynthesis protein PslH